MRVWLIGSAVAAGLLVLSAGGALGLYAAMRWRFNPPPPQGAVTANATPLQAQRDDVVLFGRLVALDRSFSPAARAEAKAMLAALDRSPTALAPPKLRMALARVAALADNGHTVVYSAPHAAPNAVPIRLFAFADGVRVLRADAADADLLGAELIGIQGNPIGRVIAALAAYRGGIAARRHEWAVQHALISPALLFGAGLAPDPTTASYLFRRLDGAMVARSLTGERPPDSTVDAAASRWLSPQPAPGQPIDWRAYRPAATPLALADPDRAFRFAWIRGGCVAYIELRANADVEGQSIGAFLQQVRRSLRHKSACGVILDLRYDGGGDYTTTAAFARALPQSLAPRAKIALLTGAETFSAGISTAAFVKAAGGDRVLILGEPVGDRMDFWSEGGGGCLPRLRLCFHYSTARHRYDGPCDDWRTCYWLDAIYGVRVRTLAPEDTIPLTFADYEAGRDAVVDRALEMTRPPS